jgi:hypothetical protein
MVIVSQKLFRMGRQGLNSFTSSNDGGITMIIIIIIIIIIQIILTCELDLVGRTQRICSGV